MKTVIELIQRLELKLLQTDLTIHSGLIDELLAENFEEIDSHGKTHSRDDVITWLMHKDPSIPWVFKDFRIKILADDWVMAVYSLQKPDQSGTPNAGSIRTSIWQRQGENWKMVFHQASGKH